VLDEKSLRSTHFRAMVQFPPLPRFGDTQLQELYVKIKQRHDFSSFTSIQNGARLSTEEVRECTILRDRISLVENIQISFDGVKRNFADILKTGKDELHIPVYFNIQYMLRSLWDLGKDADSFQLVKSSLLCLQPDQMSLLPIPPQDAGVRITCPDLPKKVHDFKIESFLRNHNYLFIELLSSFPEPVGTISILEQQMQECYDFTFENIRKLVQSLNNIPH
jgi:hypothetical protein